ncbi:MAG: hypothetical protein ACJ8DQ_03220, partial [Xanthobacteraceae bacterium]
KCTMAKWMIAPALALLLLAQPANLARAEVTELRMATQFGIGAIRNLPNIEVLNISNTKIVDLAPVARWQKPKGNRYQWLRHQRPFSRAACQDITIG